MRGWSDPASIHLRRKKCSGDLVALEHATMKSNTGSYKPNPCSLCVMRVVKYAVFSSLLLLRAYNHVLDLYLTPTVCAPGQSLLYRCMHSGYCLCLERWHLLLLGLLLNWTQVGVNYLVLSCSVLHYFVLMEPSVWIVHLPELVGLCILCIEVWMHIDIHHVYNEKFFFEL